MSLIHFVTRLALNSEFDFHVAFNGGYQELSWHFTEDGTFLGTMAGGKRCYTFSPVKLNWTKRVKGSATVGA